MRYEPPLDGLRAIAITFVVLFHADPHLFVGGWIGVDIFFVLSGYLITRILTNEIDSTGTLSFRDFYIRRLLRLGPAVGCLYLFQVTRAILSPHRSEIIGATAVSATYLMNWNRAFDLFPEDVLGHTWSLSMEEQFYLLWPVLLLVIRRQRPLLWLTAAIAAILLWRYVLVGAGAGDFRIYYGFDTHSDGLLIGCVLALIPRDAKINQLSRLGPFSVAGLWMAFFLLPATLAAKQPVVLTIVPIFAATVIAASTTNPLLRKWLSLRAMVFTGKISYGWYLWHYPLITLAASSIDRDTPRGMLLIAACIPASYLMAVLSYFVVELPFLRLKRSLRRGLLTAVPGSVQ
jgi:peptidoglycan/LPS O-acetylase OafA/YrhL